MEQTTDGMKIVKASSVSNWFGTTTTYPLVIAYPTRVEHLQQIARDRETYPNPVRAVGRIHSTTACFEADTGTIVVMRELTSMSVSHDADGNPLLTAGAGVLFTDAARFLQQKGLQFYTNVEIGDLTLGAAACVGTKESAFPGEHGQVSSYLHSVRLVNAKGELVEISASQPELLQALRSSYGLFGLVYEVTFRVKKLTAMSVHHRTFSIDAFVQFLETELGNLEKEGVSMMLYLDPFTREHLFTGRRGLVTAELRKYTREDPARATHWQWALRNFVWKTSAPFFAHFIAVVVPFRKLRYALMNMVNWFNHWFLRNVIHGQNTLPPDQVIRYPKKAGFGGYTFSIWAFPEQGYAQRLKRYFEFCQDYEARYGYRSNLLNVGYRTFKDQSSLLSYSYDGNAITADPVSTGSEGWLEFLVAYSEFAADEGGTPLFNQTPWVNAEDARRAFGPRMVELAALRERFDPAGRFFSPFFRDLLPAASTVEQSQRAVA